MSLSPQPPQTVALVDPIWIGHHATYFRAFIDAFIATGARVIALCPEPESLQDLPAAHPDKIVIGKLDDPGQSRLFRGKDHDPFLTRRRWTLASKAIDQLEEASGWKADFVFFAWLDSYLRFMVSTGMADRILRRPWTGLYFRNQHLKDLKANSLLAKVRQRLKGDFIMRSPACRMISGVDETALPHIERFTDKPVLLMPDITDETTGDPAAPIAQAIRRKARGRRVIGMVGLEKRKGFLTLLRAAQQAAAEDKPWFFAFTGVLWWETLSPNEAAWLRELLNDPPENIYLDPQAGFVPDGAVYNGMAATFDVFFAAYLNSIYNGSSNVLTKAALLRKPVLVTQGACLEDRINEFHLGLAVPEDDAGRCLEAVDRLLRGIDWEGEPLEPRYDDYFALHSHQQLEENIRLMLSTAC